VEADDAELTNDKEHDVEMKDECENIERKIEVFSTFIEKIKAYIDTLKMLQIFSYKGGR
jgi:hypothetical protein